MKCAECQKLCLENEDGNLSEDVSAHLLECATCRKAHARNVTLLQLLSLKQFEQPDAAFDMRITAKIQAGIRELDAQPKSIADKFWDLFAGGPIPALRYAMVVMVLALVGLNMVSVQNMPTLPSTSIEAQRMEAPRQATASYEATNKYFNPSLPVVFLPSNSQPSRIQYGTGPSRLVGFEY